MTRHLFLTTVFCLFISLLQAQSGCPNCTVSLPPLPADTIFLGAAPDGEVLVPYDNDVSFRLPKSTTPVHEIDPGTPAGLNISKITIIALLNVPPGLSWEPNKFEFDPGDETDGCVKFCGTPLIPGYYEVEVFVTAKVVSVNQSTSFTLPIFIAPSSSSTDGFSMQNSIGCGEVTVSFDNLVPSNGQAGYDYFWDFGNGLTSTEEQPTDVTYSNPGIYEINYEAIIDTSGYELLTVQIVDAGCNDISIPPISNAPPELYIKIKDPNGNQIYASNVIDNAPLPAAFNVNIPLGPGDYTLEVRDDDLIGSDHCGTVSFNRMTADTLEDGSLKTALSILHPVFSIQSTDTVIVYETPEPPIVNPTGNIAVCEGDSILLEADYDNNLQWYKDSTAIIGATDASLSVSAPGIFWVEYVNDFGCKAISESVQFNLISLPTPPSFSEDGNWLEVISPDLLPSDYSLQWFINGSEIPDAIETTFCNIYSGVNLFSLQVTDNETGCINEFTLGVAYDEDADCTTNSNEWTAIDQSLKIYPNPTSGLINIAFESIYPTGVQLEVYDAMGKSVLKKDYVGSVTTFIELIDLQKLSAGLYVVKIETDKGNLIRKLIKE